MASSSRTPMTAEAVFELAFVGSPRISPDGQHIVYTVKQAEYEKNRHTVHLWRVPTAGGEPQQLTFGDHANTTPRWSPDGNTLAFVSNREDKRDQIFLLPLAGGEARKLTDLDGDISDLVWAPDGSGLAAVYSPISDEEKARREAEKEGKAAERQAFKVHTTLHFKEDGRGFLFDRHSHLWWVDAGTGEARQITDGDTDDFQPAFFPDGKTLAFASNRMENPEANPENIDVCTVPVKGGKITRLTPEHGMTMSPSVSPDGKTVAFMGSFGKPGDAFWMDSHVWILPAAGGDAKRVDPDHDRSVGNLTVSDTKAMGEGLEPAVWSPDGKMLYFTITRDGDVQVGRAPAAGGKTEVLTRGEREFSDLTLDARGGRLALVTSTMVAPAEVGYLDLNEGGEPRMLSAHNRKFSETYEVLQPEVVRVETAPGTTVHGWVLSPPGSGPGDKYPAILEIHGGPHVQYSNSFFHEMQYLAACGYVVMWTNPRGSAGYGENFTRSIVQNWGGPDYDDLMKMTDHLAARDDVDETRMGVTGGSYGGYMTNWIVGHTDRFKAAVTQRSVVNLYSFYGASDFGYVFEWEFFGKPWGDEEALLKYMRMSPIHYVQNMKTPLLIIHSEEDHRCPVSQAEELYTALKVLGRTTEFVRFEGESHGLSRGGRPKNRLERLKRIRGWFDKYLNG